MGEGETGENLKACRMRKLNYAEHVYFDIYAVLHIFPLWLYSHLGGSCQAYIAIQYICTTCTFLKYVYLYM
jgi:hypothetical protein